jgi:hypothetical protein
MRSHPVRPALALACTASALALVLTPVAVSAHDSGDRLVEGRFTPSLPTDPPIAGVRAGGAPWVLGRSSVTLRENGRLDVRLVGLQIPRADGTKDNTVGQITAGVFCGGTLAARSAPQPLTVPDGDARFRVWLDVPETCDMATVLISPAANAGVYIASATATHDDED